jgi:hypothetical protein
MKVIGSLLFAIALVPTSAAWGAQAETEKSQAALSQCISLRTTGADRILTARWMFAVMAKSTLIADLATVPTEKKTDIDKDFAKLVTRLVVHDCIDQVRPLAATNVENAFEMVGQALGKTAMGELMGTKEVEEGIQAYTRFLSEADFKPLMDSLPKNQPK